MGQCIYRDGELLNETDIDKSILEDKYNVPGYNIYFPSALEKQKVTILSSWRKCCC